MNTYRIVFKIGNRRLSYDVDALTFQTAISRALNGFLSERTSDVDVSCRLYARDIQRHHNDREVRPV